MNTTARIVLLSMSLLLGRAWAQSADATFAEVESAIKAGDAQALAKHLNANVEITIADNDQDYAKNQAQFVLKEFFTNYPVKGFTLMHKGNSGDTYYAVGTYQSGRGNFDTNIFVKKHGDAYLIERIRFEKD